MGSALLLCLLFDRVKNILQDLSGGLICRLDGVCVNLAGGLCLLFDRVKNILQDLSGGLICRLDGVCVNLAGGG